MRNFAATLVSLAAVLLLAIGCSGSKSAPPSALVYSSNPATYLKGVAITPNQPSSAGGAISSFSSVAPALPAGLVMLSSTGQIVGTPTVVSPTTTYVVTASNEGGSTSAALVITVNEAPPRSLAYTTAAATYIKGTTIAANTPSSAGGTVVSYSISPSLPAGLTLNTTSGVLSGIPTALSAATAYTVTATNTGGSTTATLTITVNDTPPAGLAYTVAAPSYTKGTAIDRKSTRLNSSHT